MDRYLQQYIAGKVGHALDVSAQTRHVHRSRVDEGIKKGEKACTVYQRSSCCHMRNLLTVVPLCRCGTVVVAEHVAEPAVLGVLLRARHGASTAIPEKARMK